MGLCGEMELILLLRWTGAKWMLGCMDSPGTLNAHSFKNLTPPRPRLSPYFSNKEQKCKKSFLKYFTGTL